VENKQKDEENERKKLLGEILKDKAQRVER